MRLVDIEAKLLNPIEEAAAEAAFNARVVDARVPEWDGCREAGARLRSAGGGGVAACGGGEAFGDVHGVSPHYQLCWSHSVLLRPQGRDN